MSDLDRSEEYYRKKSLMRDNDVPTQTEIKCRLGDDLTEVLFETCMPSLKPYLGLVPVLNGPGDDLWVSPSDLLIGKVRLKPPLTNKYIKALTHQGILNIGHEIEKKLLNELQIDIKKAVAENEEIVKYVAEKEKMHAISKTKEEERIKYEKIIEDLKSDFNATLDEELKLLESDLEIEKNIAVKEAKAEVTEIMQERMDVAILETVQRLIEQFGTELLKQSKKLHAHFWFHLKQEKKKLVKAIEKEQLRYREMVIKVRREMQCENIANVMYILAVERRRCSCEKQIIQRDFQAKIAELEKEIVDQEEELRKLTVEKEENVEKVHAREQYLYEIIRQFQKFIYFVLRAVPTQAEYLLNVEKLMIFELTKTLLDTAPEIFNTNNPLTVIKSSDKIISTVSSDHGQEMTLVAPDFHNCDNIEIVAESNHTLSTNEDLPMFVFNDKTYIREDFRNMISQGLQISNSNKLWTRELENLANSLQTDALDKPLLISDTSLTDEPFKSKAIQTDESAFCFTNEIVEARPWRKVTAVSENGESSKLDADISETENRKFSNIRDSISVTVDKMDKNYSTASIQSKTKSYQPTLSCYAANLKKQTTPCCKITKPKHTQTSNFDMHVDSLVLLTRKTYGPKVLTRKSILEPRKPSKLAMSVDSLELLRSRENLKHKSKSNLVKRSSTNVLWNDRKSCNVTIQSNKTLVQSPVEFAPRVFKKRMSQVSFHVMPKIKMSDADISNKSEDTFITRKNLYDIWNKPNEARVMGDLKSTEHCQRHDEFTTKRVNSFIGIFRKHPSLRNLFTEASRN